MIRVTQDSYLSASHHKCNAIPGELLSKSTTPEKSYVWSWLCVANIKIDLFTNQALG